MKLQESSVDPATKKMKIEKKKKIKNEVEEVEEEETPVKIKKKKEKKSKDTEEPGKKLKKEKKVKIEEAETPSNVERKDKKEKKSKVNGAKAETNGLKSETNGEIISNGKQEEELSPQQKAGAFSNFRISPNTVKKLQKNGITYLFPVQSETFDIVYSGSDIITQARTGTGKTLAFSLPIIEKLQLDKSPPQRGRPPKVLVMAPTRELAKQVCEDFESYSSSLVVLCIYGGTPYGPQERVLRSGVDVIVGTPGRINDHIEKGNINLSQIKHVILDEVDNMLDMGFVEIVEQILAYAYKVHAIISERDEKPQTMLFTATLPPWVRKTANKYMREDVKTIDLIGKDFNKTSKTHLAIKCNHSERASILGDIVSVYSGNHGRAMIFCQTKKEADELAISPCIKVEGHVLHGDIAQEKRESVLKGFREGKYKVLITTDVAARGLDIPEVDIVIQCEPSKYADAYIHRSGRTGRAGRSGVCVCLYSAREEHSLRALEYKAGIKFKRTGPPTPEDIIKAASDDAYRALDDVPKETIQHFMEKAESLIEEKGACEALAAALAVISNNTSIERRSLLTAKKGYTTYICRTTVELFGPGYIWRFLEDNFPEVKDKAQSMTLLKDKMGCAFDIPTEFESTIGDEYEGRNGIVISKASEMPALIQTQNRPIGRSSWGGGGGGGSYRGRNGFNNYSNNRHNFRGSSGSSSGFGYKRKPMFSDHGGSKRTKFG
ncbi:hypothetical protein LOTGIDRAFT_221850 [Lottia gigantea]|uniref:RNA helicase n=1 Tax=Lottia gigantea TaxID=225164 RepID=V3ZKE7_LOTGI|nr:hypothetical protein LOTGIDRAFT_221850 [Lottia gigantea]ESO84752.1 hypothetical protein LOTGIDRAFT_221850 [Lottia gigantea]